MIKIFCVTNKPLPILEKSALNLAGVGEHDFSSNYINSKIKNNIHHKEKFYSELTFHYWYWKNLLMSENSDWVGFCQKRRFWVKEDSDISKINKNNLTENLLIKEDHSWSKLDSIICNPINVSGAKKMKLFKRGWRNLIRNPKLIFGKKENIITHFDMHHGYGNLSKAIKKLDNKDRDEFEKFVVNKSSYNPHIMFIARKGILDKWFTNLFLWLERCEEEFGFDSLKGYDTERLYAYLAERYLSFWFTKYTSYREHPWAFIDF